MKEIIVRENAVRAIDALGAYWGTQLYFDICKEALTGQKVDFDADGNRYYDRSSAQALYEAIAPDIVGSVVEEANVAEFLETSGSFPEAMHRLAMSKDE